MSKVGLTVAGLAAGLLVTGCASSPWPRSRAQIEIAPARCEAFQVQIYFDRDSTKLTREARSILAEAGKMARGCDVKAVRVVGLADAVGAPGDNLDLSKRRAGAVTQALGRVGFRNVSFDVQAAGDTGATTLGGANRPLRRRADINFDLAPLPR